MQIMVQSNYEILEVREDATRIEIRDAFRKLVLEHHSDRGGDDEQFKKIKQAFDDLKLGKKYPDSPEDKNKKSRFYYEDSEEEKRKRNLILSHDVAEEVRNAQEWTAALNRTDATGVRLFGSKELGQLEFERKATKALSIKGKFWAGNLTYNGPLIMWGSISNPYFSEKEHEKTRIHVINGKFSLIDPIENGYVIENGAKIIVDNGDIIVGDVFGKKEILPDPSGKGGMIKFHDQGSGFDISDDAIIRLENGKEFRLHDLKKSELIGYGGTEITYEYLDNIGTKKSQRLGNRWLSKLGF